LIIDSQLIEEEKGSKIPPGRNRKMKDEQFVYAYIDCFLMFSVILMSCGQGNFTEFIKEIGKFFVIRLFFFIVSRLFISLWTLADRGRVNELLLHFLILLSPSGELQSKKKRMELLELLMVFWKVIVESEHFISLSYLSGQVKTLLNSEFFSLFF
jgi:hypothetical protein